MIMQLSYFFWLLAAICNAIMDTLVHHYDVSIFKKYNNSNFWNPNYSWYAAKKIFGWKLDAWHISKSLMIVFICLSISLGFYYKPLVSILDFIVIFGLWGIIWNVVFNLFYNNILRK